MPKNNSVEFISNDLDYVLVVHDDETEAVTKSTENAFRYLKQLKKSIPVPDVGVVESAQACRARG